ncbi:aspartyl protease family protein At5g10770-like [Oryza brachyantha]|uniref:aspartyl protease family protein At5g10770-like n=1 Tax=Oryza brachyantha TaxID=4533 RepID=UPI0003EAAC0A|nr:aspartyl protease family protein At5g10770-like [Oryza brachyantha]
MAYVSLALLLLLCSCHSFVAHAGDEQSYKVLDLNPRVVCSERNGDSSGGGGTTLTLNHRYGPCSPVPSEKRPISDEELLRRDQLRAEYIRRKLSRSNGTAGEDGGQQSKVTVPTTLGTSLDTLEYVISVGLGSPAVKQMMCIDTGSDVSWVQCKPCPIPPCHAAGSLFDPAASSTYAAFNCSAAACKQLGKHANGCDSKSQCQYIVRYGDDSNTTGTYGSDKLTLSASDVVEGFQFGCSHAELGTGMNDKIDGLMGLGGGAQSLVSQTAANYGKSFSYCLPPTAASSGFLTLGARSSGGGGNGTSQFVTTPMLRVKESPTFYFAALKDIAVGGKKLGLPPSVFSAGSLMDSGTIITRLPPTAYSALSSAFQAGMKQYKKAQPSSIFDTCFDFTGLDKITIPAVALVFSGGAVVDLDAHGILHRSCLAFAPNADEKTFSTIGNVQQRTFEVLYDVGSSVFGFRAGAC